MRIVEESRPDRPEIREALAHLADVSLRTLPVRYARMWLAEAQQCSNQHDEIRYLAKAESELGRAVLASARPTPELSRAFQLTMEARREAAD